MARLLKGNATVIAQQLHVKGAEAVSYNILNQSKGNSHSGIRFQYDATTGGDDYVGWVMYANYANNILYFNSLAGETTASLTTAGTWTSVSDERSKKDIVDMTYGLDTVLASKPRSFKMKADSAECIGFVSQEIKPLIPEVVHGGEIIGGIDTFFSLDYGSLTAVAFKAIQELSAKNDILEARVTALENA